MTGDTPENQPRAATPAQGGDELPPASRVWPAGLRSLRHKNYRVFLAGQLISVIGTWVQSVAQSWLIYKLTDSAVLLGLVSFVGQIPLLLLSPLGGAAADRFNRRHIIIATQVVSMLLALALAVLTLSGYVREWHLFVLAGALGITNAFDIPARQSFAVDIVGRADLTNAIALNTATFNGARMIGPAVAGALVASFGEGWCFLINGLSYIPVLAGLLWMRVVGSPRQVIDQSVWAHMAEGFRYAAQTRPILILLLLIALLSAMGTPYIVLMPIFADRILHGGPSGLGLLMAAAGGGSLVGAVTLALRGSIRGLGRWVAWSALGFGATLILFALSKSFWLSALLLPPVGFCMIVALTSSNTLIQSMVPDRLRGRVVAIYSMMLLGMAPLGALLAGAVADGFGAAWAVALGGIACACGGAFFYVGLPRLRIEAKQIIDAVEHEVANGITAPKNI